MPSRVAARLLLLAFAFSPLLCPSPGHAQPAGRTVTIVVPVTPGTGQDILARTLSDEFQNRLGQPVVVDNKAGASGNIGTQYVARSAPDGLTLLITSTPLTQNIGLFKSVPYDPVT